MRKIFLGVGIVVLVGVFVCVMHEAQNAEKTLGIEYIHQCETTFKSPIVPIFRAYRAIKSCPDIVTPLSGEITSEDGVVTYKGLDVANMYVTVKLSQKDVRVVYTTSYEDKHEILRIMKLLCGKDVVCNIAEEKVDGYVAVEAQGLKYRWTDGTLIRVP